MNSPASSSGGAPALDAAALRADFPLLSGRPAGEPLIYLDSAATAQRPQAVIDAEIDYLVRANAAVHRGAHMLAADATELFGGQAELRRQNSDTNLQEF